MDHVASRTGEGDAGLYVVVLKVLEKLSATRMEEGEREPVAPLGAELGGQPERGALELGAELGGQPERGALEIREEAVEVVAAHLAEVRQLDKLCETKGGVHLARLHVVPCMQRRGGERTPQRCSGAAPSKPPHSGWGGWTGRIVEPGKSAVPLYVVTVEASGSSAAVCMQMACR